MNPKFPRLSPLRSIPNETKKVDKESGDPTGGVAGEEGFLKFQDHQELVHCQDMLPNHYAMAGLKTCLVIHSQDPTAEYLLNCKIGIYKPITCNDNLSAVRLETTKMLLEPLNKLKQADARLNMTQGVLEGVEQVLEVCPATNFQIPSIYRLKVLMILLAAGGLQYLQNQKAGAQVSGALPFHPVNSSGELGTQLRTFHLCLLLSFHISLIDEHSSVSFDPANKLSHFCAGFDKSEIKLYQFRGGSELLVEAGDQRRVLCHLNFREGWRCQIYRQKSRYHNAIADEELRNLTYIFSYKHAETVTSHQML
ncbi:hypothetical protein HAX54_017380 [Datura stramonium]|uniref:Uncharacterized protein n=1 Tax=Datura stramonium TaxID=4076 RepID=A0ABS8S0C4_DATST|nr:hypothetical protein [Datura stramonium]